MDILGFTLLVVAAVDDCRTHGDIARITRFGREYRWTSNIGDGRIYIHVEPVSPPFGMASAALDGSNPHMFGANASVAA